MRYALWERLTGPERFYLKMLDIEAPGIKKIDNYQNFAKGPQITPLGRRNAISGVGLEVTMVADRLRRRRKPR